MVLKKCPIGKKRIKGKCVKKQRYSYFKTNSWTDGETFNVVDNKKIWDAEKKGRGAGNVTIKKFTDKTKLLKYMKKLRSK